ncbi:MAG: hypothetical protein EZS28_037324, partial [Streblomastix strix]
MSTSMSGSPERPHSPSIYCIACSELADTNKEVEYQRQRKIMLLRQYRMLKKFRRQQYLYLKNLNKEKMAVAEFLAADGRMKQYMSAEDENNFILSNCSNAYGNGDTYENKVMVAFTTKSEQPKVQPQQRRQSRMSIGMKNHQNSVYSNNGPKKRMSIFQQIHPDQRAFIYNLFPWMRNMRQKFYQQYYYFDIQVKNYLLEMYQVAVLYKQRGYEVVYADNKPIFQSKKWVDYFLRAVDNEVVMITDPRRFDQQGLLAEIKNEGSDSQQGTDHLFEGTLRTGQFKT